MTIVTSVGPQSPVPRLTARGALTLYCIVLIEAAFRSWESSLAAGLRRMQERGELDARADPSEFATGLVAAYQGGYLLSQVARSSRPMAVALDLALDSIEARRGRADGAPGRRADAVPARTAVA
jgi:hypothetical protein